MKVKCLPPCGQLTDEHTSQTLIARGGGARQNLDRNTPQNPRREYEGLQLLCEDDDCGTITRNCGFTPPQAKQRSQSIELCVTRMREYRRSIRCSSLRRVCRTAVHVRQRPATRNAQPGSDATGTQQCGVRHSRLALCHS